MVCKVPAWRDLVKDEQSHFSRCFKQDRRGDCEGTGMYDIEDKVNPNTESVISAGLPGALLQRLVVGGRFLEIHFPTFSFFCVILPHSYIITNNIPTLLSFTQPFVGVIM